MADTKQTDPVQQKAAGDRLGKDMTNAVVEATDRVRQRASEALTVGAKAVDDAPLTALAGALAIGAVVAALIPTSSRELNNVGPLGTKLRGLLDEAFHAAKSAGMAHLTTQGLTSAALTSGLGQSIGHLVTAAMAASNAASTTVRKRDGTATQTN